MDTNANSPSGAVAKVLDTVELLESVLLELDERTLLLSQRVDKMFQATIKGSVKLQRKLGFLPTPSEPTDSLAMNALLFKITSTCRRPGLKFMFLDPSLHKPYLTPHFGRLTIIEDNENGAVTCPKEGSWRNMLVSRDGRGFNCFLRYVKNVDLNYEDSYGSKVVANEGCTAGELADRTVRDLDSLRKMRENPGMRRQSPALELYNKVVWRA